MDDHSDTGGIPVMPMKEVHLRRWQVVAAFVLVVTASFVALVILRDLQEQANDNRKVICQQTKIFINSNITLQSKTLESNAKDIQSRTDRVDSINGLLATIADFDEQLRPEQKKTLGVRIINQFRIYLRSERKWLLSEAQNRVTDLLDASRTADQWRGISRRLMCDKLGST